jgi:primosomal protein N'
MICPKCSNENASPRRCPNCGHRWPFDAVAAGIAMQSRKLRPLIPRPRVGRNKIVVFPGKAVAS